MIAISLAIDINNAEQLKALKSLIDLGAEIPDPVSGFYPNYPKEATFKQICDLNEYVYRG